MCEKKDKSISELLINLLSKKSQCEKCNCNHLSNCSPGNIVNNESQQSYFGVNKK